MVRVISVHHFANQHIQTVEQPTASTIAPPNRLLLALLNHSIEVRDLKAEAELLFTFPTVDEVKQLVHCVNGDYVATLEAKCHRQKEANYVRVYLNWDSVAALQQSKMTSSGVSLGSSECGMVQPMRARIAGRVTPTTNQSEVGNLEMIEIPVKRHPDLIECCQVSGNILILTNKTLMIYSFVVKTHDISKLKFVDFEEVPVSIQLNFVPEKINFSENYVACMNKDSFHLFRVLVRARDERIQAKFDDYGINCAQDSPISFRKLLREEKLNASKEKITVNLPTILKDNSAVHKHSPFTYCDKDMVAYMVSNSPLENRSGNYEIQNLVQLRLKPIMIENAQTQITEEFKCLQLKPLYVARPKPSEQVESFLKSNFNYALISVSCFITTQQEGYLFQFNDSVSNSDEDNCVAVYSFTAPILKLALEDYLLHALTETGLESYTLRTGHQLFRNLDVIDDVNSACPSTTDSVCLIGLRPFLGIEQILISENYLVLLANADSSPTHSIGSNSSSNASFWTLYNLELPTPKAIFNDISIMADSHRFTSPQTYCHLMSEAHVILRTALYLSKWRTLEGNVSLIALAAGNTEDLIETYRLSCALLGDHYIMCSNEQDYVLCVPYYKMAGVKPFEVLKRAKKLQEQSNIKIGKGHIYYLKSILLEIKSSSDAAKLFNLTSKQNFAEEILELFGDQNFDDLPSLILKSGILRENASYKFITILKKGRDCNEKILALVVLLIQRGDTEEAQKLLQHIADDDLKKSLSEHWELLFEPSVQTPKKQGTTFSDLTVILMAKTPAILSELFVSLILDKRRLHLQKLLKTFVDYLPSRIDSDGNTGGAVFQKTLEIYFQRFYELPENKDLSKISYDRPTHEALKILVRSYLSQLQLFQLKDSTCAPPQVQENKEECVEIFRYNQVNETYFEETKKSKPVYLFCHSRYEYLDKMPPFQEDVLAKLYPSSEDENTLQPNEEACFVLKKLQSLLCSQVVPHQVIIEVNAFLSLNINLRGNLSLQSISMNANDCVAFLLDVCPQCLLQYGKDRFTKIDEWKLLIVSVQRRILRLSHEPELSRVCTFYKKLLDDMLTEVAMSMNLEQLLHVFPQRSDKYRRNDDLIECYSDEDEKVSDNGDVLNEIQNYDRYIVICKETMHANQIRKLISATGQQLLCTLNL